MQQLSSTTSCRCTCTLDARACTREGLGLLLSSGAMHIVLVLGEGQASLQVVAQPSLRTHGISSEFVATLYSGRARLPPK
jgi:hypothetical protein